MFYSFVKILIRAASKFFFRKISINNLAALKTKGPLLLACNHPNSFLDAIILGSLFNEPVHFLARGDAFRKPFARKLLTSLKLIPIYRLSEGREYLALNDATFECCREILINNGIVLIFAEGLCINQWMLRPLKKGAARIAIDAWKNPSIAEQFSVLPVSLNYNSFTHFKKRLIINFGEPITKKEFSTDASEGESIHQFNTKLSERLKSGLLQSVNETSIVQTLISNHLLIKKNAKTIIQTLKIKQESAISNHLENLIGHLKSPFLLITSSLMLLVNISGIITLFIPAIIGLLLNGALYFPVKNFIKNKTKETVFFDSVMFGLLMILYPLFWLILNLVFLLITRNNYIRLLILLMPVFAFAFLIWNECVQRVVNYFSLNKKERKIIKQVFN